MAGKSLKRGIFITFEGPEGSGKSTHSKLTFRFLRKEGYDVVYTREPGGTKIGDKIRDILLDSKNLDISSLCEMLLFEASRVELVRQVIRPALLKKRIVISDRFNDATMVYQGYAGGLSMKAVEKVESIYLEGIRPDLTIVLDIDPEEGLKKIKSCIRDRMESKRLSFHKKVRRGYINLAQKEKKRIKLIKTEDTIDATFKKVKEAVLDVLESYLQR